MAGLKEIMIYFLKRQPGCQQSNARLTKMIYLADWRHAIKHGCQLSDIKWRFDNFGPFVWEPLEVAKSEKANFKVSESSTFLDNRKSIKLHGKNQPDPVLSEPGRETLEHVIQTTNDLNWSDFITLVYSTYPVLTSERFSTLDLVGKAEEYNALESKH
jgi:hypothetical protein